MASAPKGYKPHPSDDLLQSRIPAEIEQVRADWDLLASHGPDLEAALKRLLKAQAGATRSYIEREGL